MSDTKVKIIETAVTAFSRHGLRRVSMSDVAEQAHISRQTLYAHYKNKDELFLAAMESAYASSLVDLKAAWGKAKKLSDVIDAYYEIAVFRPFDGKTGRGGKISACRRANCALRRTSGRTQQHAAGGG